MTIQEDVAEFHRAFGVPVLTVPTVPPDERVRLRLRLIAEEFFELLEACYGDREIVKKLTARPRDEVDYLLSVLVPRPDLPEVADALADIAYVVAGSNLEFGIDGDAVLDVVHKSNMAKIGGEKRADGKIMKPVGWVGPDIAGELERQRSEAAGELSPEQGEVCR